MTCGCAQSRRDPSRLRAEEHAVSAVSTAWRRLLQLEPTEGSRHVVLSSDDCSVVWRIVTWIDRVEHVTYYQSGPLSPAFVRIPPDGARVDYWVRSIEASGLDPIAGSGGDPHPRVVAVASGLDSSLESAPYVPSPPPATLPGSQLPRSGSLILVSHRIASLTGAGTYALNWNQVPPGQYRIRSMYVGSEIPSLTGLSLEIFSSSVLHPASIWLDAEARSRGGHACWVGTASPLDTLVTVGGSGVPSDGLRGRIFVEFAEQVTGAVEASVLLESYAPHLRLTSAFVTFTPMGS